MGKGLLCGHNEFIYTSDIHESLVVCWWTENDEDLIVFEKWFET